MASKEEKNGKIFEVISVASVNQNLCFEKKEKTWSINREMLPFKLHFFIFFGAMGSILPFITVFAKTQIGLSASSLSAIYTSQQFIFILTKPCIGLFVDHFNKLKLTIIMLSVVQIVAFFLLLPIPSITSKQSDMPIHEALDYTKICSMSSTDKLPSLNQSLLIEEICENAKCSSTTQAVLCLNQNKQSGNISDDADLYMDSFNIKADGNSCSYCGSHNESVHCDENCRLCTICYNPSVTETEDIVVFNHYQFWLFAFFSILAAMCANALFTLSDTACYESLTKTGSDYGRQRLWGAVSWGIICPIAGCIIDYTGEYLYAWCLMGVMTVLQIVNIARLDLVKPHMSQNILKDMKIVLKSQELISFGTGVFMNGVCTGVIWYYLVWFLQSIGGTRFLIGLVNAVQCFVGELPFMFYSGWIIKKIGHFNILTLTSVAYFVRFFAYSYIHNPWYTLPMEGIHGVTYGIFYATMTSFAKVSSKPGTEATTQSVLCILYEGFGAGLGCILAGLGFDRLGVHRTFFWMSILSAVSFVINVGNTWRVKCKRAIADVKENAIA